MSERTHHHDVNSNGVCRMSKERWLWEQLTQSKTELEGDRDRKYVFQFKCWVTFLVRFVRHQPMPQQSLMCVCVQSDCSWIECSMETRYSDSVIFYDLMEISLLSLFLQGDCKQGHYGKCLSLSCAREDEDCHYIESSERSVYMWTGAKATAISVQSHKMRSINNPLR